jgi:hypothetical protein
MLFIVIRGLAEAEPFDLLLPLWMITLMSAIVEPARMLTPDNQGAGIIAADSQLREQDLPVRGKPVL